MKKSIKQRNVVDFKGVLYRGVEPKDVHTPSIVIKVLDERTIYFYKNRFARTGHWRLTSLEAGRDEELAVLRRVAAAAREVVASTKFNKKDFCTPVDKMMELREAEFALAEFRKYK